VARYLYIVSKHEPLIYGYLQVFIESQRSRRDSFELIFDRRSPGRAGEGFPPSAEDRRVREGIDETLLATGYAIVRREEGAASTEALGDDADAADDGHVEAWVRVPWWRRGGAWRLAAAGLIGVVLAAGALILAAVGPGWHRADDGGRLEAFALGQAIRRGAVPNPKDPERAPSPTTFGGPVTGSVSVQGSPPALASPSGPKIGRVEPGGVRTKADASSSEALVPGDRRPPALRPASPAPDPPLPSADRGRTASSPSNPSAPERPPVASPAPARLDPSTERGRAESPASDRPGRALASAVSPGPSTNGQPDRDKARQETPARERPSRALASAVSPPPLSRASAAPNPSTSSAAASPSTPPPAQAPRPAPMPASPTAAAPTTHVQSQDAFPGLPRVEISREASGGQDAYAIRVSRPDGSPVAGAEVWLQGRAADGKAIQAQLAPAQEPGLYRGSAPAASRATAPLSVRVVTRSMRFEVPVNPSR